MQLYKTHIIEKKKILDDTYIFRLHPKPFNFLPGQYVFLQNTLFKPDDPHPFSIASSPFQKNCLEFCIKKYGQWTQTFSQKEKGEIVYISEPQGNFLWDQSIEHAVVLLGGIGISPIMS